MCHFCIGAEFIFAAPIGTMRSQAHVTRRERETGKGARDPPDLSGRLVSVRLAWNGSDPGIMHRGRTPAL